jgi:Fe-S cluster assembly protein SufD
MAAIDTVNQYQADFEQAAQRAAGQPAWLAKLRQDGFDRFTAQGFPTTRQEEWRFTNVAPIAEGQFQLAPRVAIDKAAIAALGLQAPGLDQAVVVNGRFDPGLSSLGSLPPGMVVGGLGQ